MRRLSAILLIAAVTLCGCHKQPPRPNAPRPRIVSFSPALTDVLYDVGLGEHVVGVTSYCQTRGQDPPPVVGDRNRVSAEAILAVEPDVILIQQNPDDFGAVRYLAPGVRIEHFTIETLDDIAAAAARVGVIAGDEAAGLRHKERFLNELESVRRSVAGLPRPGVLFLNGFDRPGTGGKGTFVDEMIRLAGGVNVAAERGYERYPTLNRENIQAMAPDVLVCQVAPGQEDAARAYWQTLADLPAVRSGRVFIVTEQGWTIPSLRSAEYAKRLAAIIHPDSAGKEPGDD